MSPLVARVAAQHQGLWTIDQRYRAAWYVWPSFAALGVTGWLLAAPAAPMPGAGFAPWGKPAASAQVPSSSRPEPAGRNEPAVSSPDIQTCKGNDTPLTRIEACTRALADARLPLAEQAELFFKRGFAKGEASQVDQSIQDYTEALKRNPNHYWALNNRGSTYNDKNQPRQALIDLDKAIAISPAGHLALTNRAEAYYLLEDYDKAIADASAAVRAAPTYYRASLFRGLAYREKSEFEPALRDLDAYLKQTPGDARALRNRSAVKLALNRYDESIADAAEALRLDPGDSVTLTYRCAAFFLKNDLTQAEQDCNEALRLNPKLWFASEYRGRIHMARNRYQAAINDLNSVPNIEKRPAALEARARAYLNLENYSSAESDALKWTQTQPRNAGAHNLLGFIVDRGLDARRAECDKPLDPAQQQVIGARPVFCLRPIDYSAPIQSFSTAIELDAKYATPLVNRGRIRIKEGNLQQALEDLNRGIQLDPRNADAYFFRGNVAVRQSRPADAIVDFTSSIQINPRGIYALYNRANAHLEQGNRQAAVNDLRAAIQVAPNYDAAKALLLKLGQRP